MKTYEIVYAFTFDADDDEEARRRVRAILLRLGDVARNERCEITPQTFRDQTDWPTCRDVPFATPLPDRPILVSPEETQAARDALRHRLEASSLRAVPKSTEDPPPKRA